MSSRIFQSVVSQMKEISGCTLGVIDANGAIIACNEPGQVGSTLPAGVRALSGEHENIVTAGGNTYKALASWGVQFDYAAFVSGEDEKSRLICSMAVVALNEAKAYYEEKHDRAAFVKSIICDNILMGDIYVRAKELHFPSDVPRVVLLIRQTATADMAVFDTVQALFPERQTDFVLALTETDVALIKQVPEGVDGKTLYKLAKQIEDTVANELELKVVIGIGSVVGHVQELSRAYKEAQLAIEVSKVFEVERTIVNYENLGIGRLVYQLPTTLCEKFLQEVFKINPITALDQDTLFTINRFFENNLNVSETARKLFVHRNTLVYRLDKIKKITGLDLREFDDAITFKVALMVKKYLASRGKKI